MTDTSSQPEPQPAAVPTERIDVPAQAVPVGPKVERPAPDPTRYGDWEKNGRCIDF